MATRVIPVSRHVAGVCIAAAMVCAAGAPFAGARGNAVPTTFLTRSPARVPASDATRVLAAVNAHRREARLPALSLDARLTQAAATHARDLARRGRLDHRGSDGSRVGRRVERAGYRWSAVAENLALSRSASAPIVVEMWMNSRGHRANILNRECSQMGVAHVGDIWVLVLARPR